MSYKRAYVIYIQWMIQNMQQKKKKELFFLLVTLIAVAFSGNIHDD